MSGAGNRGSCRRDRSCVDAIECVRVDGAQRYCGREKVGFSAQRRVFRIFNFFCEAELLFFSGRILLGKKKAGREKEKKQRDGWHRSLAWLCGGERLGGKRIKRAGGRRSRLHVARPHKDFNFRQRAGAAEPPAWSVLQPEAATSACRQVHVIIHDLNSHQRSNRSCVTSY